MMVFFKAQDSLRSRLRLFVLCIVASISACSNVPDQTLKAPTQSADPALYSASAWNAGHEAVAKDRSECVASGSLHNLWIRRMKEGADHDYPIGAGDVLEISVTDVDELKQLEVRVTGEGTIDLPLVGELPVVGLREDDVRELIAKKLKGLVLEPSVHVFVREYRSRSVTVMGMVDKPGTYALASTGDSILDMIGRAGGIRTGGAQRVVLFPGEPTRNNLQNSANSDPRQGCADAVPNQSTIGGSEQSVEPCKAGELPARNLTEAPEPAGAGSYGNLGNKVEPIIIELDQRSSSACLNVPARPNDEVLVPAAGQVGVYGWVARPGTFEITPGMTVLGAITSAGGALYSSNAEVLRKSAEGERTVLPLDLSKLEDGRAVDVPVQAGDLVLVKYSVLGAIPYSVMQVLHFSSGVYLPVPY
jgi:polysaccharide export outer membrane protein